MATYIMLDDAVQKIRRQFSIASQVVDELEKQWFKAASKCDLEKLKTIHKEDKQLINKKDYFTGYAAIHWACKLDRDDVIRWLYQNKSDINIQTFGGYTPLHIASMHGKEISVRNLIQYYEADLNIRDYSGRKAKHYLKPDTSVSIQRALQATPSVLDIHQDPSFQMSIRNQPQKLSTPPLSRANTVDTSTTNSEDNVIKKKKRTLSISHSFKKGRKMLIEKRSLYDNRPASPTTPRRHKSTSVPDLNATNNNYIISAEESQTENQLSFSEASSITQKKNSISETVVNGYAYFINSNRYHRKLTHAVDSQMTDQPWGINTWV